MTNLRPICLIALFLFQAVPHAQADDTADIAQLRAEIEVLKAEIKAIQAALPAPPPPAGPMLPVARFDGRWEGKIVPTGTSSNCRQGDIRIEVKDGKVEGSRWFFSGYVAPVKGEIKPDGSYAGYQNRAFMVGRFDGDKAVMQLATPNGGCDHEARLQRAP